MNNKKDWLLYLFSFSLVFILSCGQVLSKYPLPQSDSIVDDRLVGTWSAKMNKNKIFVHIGKQKNGMYKALLVEPNNDGTYEDFRFSFFSVAINSNRYLNLKLTGSSVEGDDTLDAEDIKNANIIAEYKIDRSGKLYISLLNGDKFRDSQNREGSGTGSGVIKLKNYITINQSSEELKSVLKERDSDSFKLLFVLEKWRS